MQVILIGKKTSTVLCAGLQINIEIDLTKQLKIYFFDSVFYNKKHCF